MKMHDIGHKTEPIEIVKPEKNKKSYPSIKLSDKDLPCLKGSKVGDELSLIMDCEITGTNKRDNNPTEYTLEVRKLGEEDETKMSEALEKASEEKEE